MDKKERHFKRDAVRSFHFKRKPFTKIPFINLEVFHGGTVIHLRQKEKRYQRFNRTFSSDLLQSE
jgi:hypothetical protein